jgi:chromosome segregation ATPase
MSTIEHKQGGFTGGIGLDEILDWIAAKITSLFSRTEEIEQADTPANDGTPVRAVATNAVALRGALATLQDHLERVTEEWQRVEAEAAKAKQDIDDMTGGIRALTDNFATQYAASSAQALTNRLDARAQQWDELNARATELNRVVIQLQDQVQAVEDQIKGHEDDLLEAKAFWDPQDDEDVAALKERIDSLAARVEQSIADNDEDEQAELRAELNDLDDGLTDDTRFRVQALLERLGDDKSAKSAGGAHALYR